jgi:hypothetical protein
MDFSSSIDNADLHPRDGPQPPQPHAPTPDAAVLGASPWQDYPTTGAPPMIGRALTLDQFRAYLAAYQFGSLAPDRTVLHHTVIPTISSWRGLATMRGMQRYYRDLGWSSAPHIYIGPEAHEHIWLFTPMSRIGIHAGTGNGSVREKWYSIGVEMVGLYDQVAPSGTIWETTRAVLALLCQRFERAPAETLPWGVPNRPAVAFHRHFPTKKSCPGWAVTEGFALGGVEAALQELHARTAYTEHSPIMADWHGDAAQLAQTFAARCRAAGSPYATEAARPLETVIVPAYIATARAVGIDPVVALAQCGHETGWLTSALSQRRDRNGNDLRNPAGLGVSGEESHVPRAGFAWDADRQMYRRALGFPDWQAAIRSHIGRLLAYCLADREATHTQRTLIDEALARRPLRPVVRGSASTLAHLGAARNPANAEALAAGVPSREWPVQGWAFEGWDYGERLAAAANSLR